MDLLGWLRRRGPAEDPRLKQWREEWQRAAEHWDDAAVPALRTRLDSMALPDEEVEVEREMLEALSRLGELSAAPALPLLETGHRVVHGEPCYFSAPASLPDDPSQPGGRVLLTGGRAIFVGGAAGAAVPWHAVSRVSFGGRDVTLVRTGGDRLYRFRFNSYGDALCAAFIARRLSVDQRKARQRPRET